jgi:chromate transport protein ChrA
MTERILRSWRALSTFAVTFLLVTVALPALALRVSLAAAYGSRQVPGGSLEGIAAAVLAIVVGSVVWLISQRSSPYARGAAVGSTVGVTLLALFLGYIYFLH